MVRGIGESPNNISCVILFPYSSSKLVKLYYFVKGYRVFKPGKINKKISIIKVRVVITHKQNGEYWGVTFHNVL